MTAEEVKAALRKRHPAIWPGTTTTPGQWTVLEEFMGIDLLAMSSWAGHRRVGYEVKVSRHDLRRELLSPPKRERAVELCHSFYFAVPAGLLTKEEAEWEQPEDWTLEDFSRAVCTNEECYASGRSKRRRSSRGPRVKGTEYEGVTVQRRDERGMLARGMCCVVCRGRGTVDKSRAEREAPTLWIPPDVGLIEVYESGTSRAKRKAPFTQAPLLVKNNSQLHDLVRWASVRPDPRHAACGRST